MDYSKIYNKLIALSQDQSTTPGERRTAANKAAHIKKKYLDKGQHFSQQKPFRTAQGGNPFAGRPDPVDRQEFIRRYMTQFNAFNVGSIFSDNPHLKEQLKQAIFGVIKERDELKRKGEL